MRSINSLDELKMPLSHKIYLEHLLDYFKTCPKIEKVFLFGSCAKGEATRNSDIDLYILGSDISDEDEWNITWKCPKPEGADYVSCDLLSDTCNSFEKMSKVAGMVQCAIKLMGIDISG